MGVVLTRTGHVYEQRSLGFGISPLPIPGGGSVALGYIFDPYGNRAYRYDIDPFVGGFGITGRIGVSGGSVSPGSDLQAKELALSTDVVSVSASAAREIRDLGSDLWH